MIILNLRGPVGLPTFPSPRAGLRLPENTDLAEPDLSTFLPRLRKSLTWLKLNNETKEAARHDG